MILPMLFLAFGAAGGGAYQGAGWLARETIFPSAGRLAAMEFGFVAGRLTSVTHRVDSFPDYLLMKEELFGRFGRGRISEDIDSRPERFVWEKRGSTTTLVSDFNVP